MLVRKLQGAGGVGGDTPITLVTNDSGFDAAQSSFTTASFTWNAYDVFIIAIGWEISGPVVTAPAGWNEDYDSPEECAFFSWQPTTSGSGTFTFSQTPSDRYAYVCSQFRDISTSMYDNRSITAADNDTTFATVNLSAGGVVYCVAGEHDFNLTTSSPVTLIADVNQGAGAGVAAAMSYASVSSSSTINYSVGGSTSNWSRVQYEFGS